MGQLILAVELAGAGLLTLALTAAGLILVLPRIVDIFWPDA